MGFVCPCDISAVDADRLETYASGVGLHTVLAQKQDDGQIRPIAHLLAGCFRIIMAALRGDRA